ncbi:hypothetical protein [Thermococcus waiotapuensis]|uniref:Uncharacterized protein n=1 Tax=Thermococcus waiotapuensis TaxID=90909 RepID=A0AAE4NTU6_9EURY|nr:hypothetical protein [Thermococcus waiotapuensis]MDV3104218.1 hypothetical protein [Thermococcus waiotapuensis]
MIEYVWLVAGILGVVFAMLDLKAGENKEETLKDLFLGTGFLLWYLRRDVLGSVFMLAAALVYLPEFRKKLIRWRHG